ncbi:lantibiotic dehydratase [Lentzea sp. NPDC051208]|uniref:lantibiotic dehydratase n=1 Tax=Lentzea sp. NPDC051208 TaxID=3154642 RepID=UPI003438FC92
MPDTPEKKEPVLLPDGGWRLWEQFALRGPGFPADGVLRIVPPGLALAADKFGEDDTLAGADWDEFAEEFEAAAVRTAVQLQGIAAQPRFQAAVAWQNRAVLDTGIASFLAWTPDKARSSMPRQREELVAHYWQRFCVKNDTIGFFGPVGWGRWDLSADGLSIDPGSTGFLSGSHVYFASWAIDALAKVLDADPAFRAWVPPRRVSFVRFDGERIAVPGRPAQDIPADARAVLELCDGTRPVPAIAAALGRGVDEVTEIVLFLVRKRWAHWRLEVPSATYPERELRAIVERVGDEPVKAAALAKLDVLERGRDAVAAAGQDATALIAALTALENEFADITATEAQRAKGQRTAPCRALAYSDCTRAATATLGRAVLDELTPLQMCLTAARWMTNRFGAVIGARVREAYDKVLARHGSVDLASLWFECLPTPHAASIADMDAIQDELRAKWARILDVPSGPSRVRISSADIAEQVRAEFGEPGAGWSLSRYFSPDLLVLAEDADAVARGEFELVLGEMHCALNTMGASLFVHQHPERHLLAEETARDFPTPRLLPMLPKELPLKWSARSRPSLDRPEDYYVAMVDHTTDPHRPRTVLSGDVAVHERGEKLVAVLPDGAEFDVLDAYANAMTHRVMDRFTLRPAAEHSPRVTIDRMVVARETWRVTASELDFTEEKSEARRFVRARHWQRSLDLPRYVFAVSPAEPRPFYVDFDNPIYVTILSKAVRRLARKDPAAKITFSEMLPNPEQAWLTDDEGRKYTSELRFVAVDQTAVESAPVEAS